MTRRKLAPRKSSMQKQAYSSEWMETVDQYAGTGIAYLALLTIVILSWIPLPISGIAPYWAIVPVFVWSVRREQLLPGILVFIMGILSDIVIGTPLGVHAFSLLLIALLARLQQRYLAMQNFVSVWIDFAALSMLFSLLVTGMTVLAGRDYNGAGAAFMSCVISWAIIVVLFPLFSLAAHSLLSLVKKIDI